MSVSENQYQRLVLYLVRGIGVALHVLSNQSHVPRIVAPDDSISLGYDAIKLNRNRACADGDGRLENALQL